MIHALQCKGRCISRVLGVIGLAVTLCLATGQLNSRLLVAQDSLSAKSRRTGTSTLSGRVLDPDGKPVAKATIEAFSVNPDVRFHIRTETDSEGNWTANRGRAPGQMWAK